MPEYQKTTRNLQWRGDGRQIACLLLAILIASAWNARARDTLEKAGAIGVVVETVSKGSAAESAGIRPGDVLLSWSLTSTTAQSSQPTGGKIESGFDLAEIETEQANRALVSISGLRGENKTTWPIPMGIWGLAVHPNYTGDYLRLYQEGKSFLDAKKITEGAQSWRQAGEMAVKAGDVKLAAGFQYQIARAFTVAKMWTEADAAYQEASRLAESSKDLVTAAQIQKTHGMVFQSRNDWQHAEQCFRKELELNQSIGGNRISVGLSLTDLAILTLGRGDADTATDEFERAEKIFEKSAPDSLAVANGLHNLGALKLSRGQTDAAAEYFKRALPLKEKYTPGSLNLASTLNNLGIIATDQGHQDEAEKYLKESLEIREKLAPNSMLVSGSLNNLGTVAQRKLQYAEAEKYFRESLAIREKLAPGGVEVSRCLQNLGTLAHERGDLAGAEELYDQVLPIQEKWEPGSLDLLGTLHDIGNVAEERGDLEKAEDYLRQALAISEKLSPDSVDSARNLCSLASISGDRADYDMANEYLDRALKIMEAKEPDSTDVAAALNQIGRMAYDQSDLARAENFYKRSLDHARKRLPGGLDEASALGNLGLVAGDRGDLESAQKYDEQFLAIVEKLAPDGLHVASALDGLGVIAQKKKDYASAEKMTKQALDIREKLAPGSAVESRSLHNLGVIYRETGKTDLAREYLCKAVDAVEKQKARLGGTQEASEAFGANFAGYYQDCLEMLVATGRAADAFQVLERERARVLLNMLAERDLLFTADIPAELVRERNMTNAEYDHAQSKLAELSPGKDRERIEALLAQLRDIHQKQEQISEKIRSASPRMASLQYPQPLDVSGVRSALDPGTVLLSYSVGKEKSLLFVLSAQAAQTSSSGLSVFTIPVADKALRARVEAFRGTIQARDPDRTSLDQQARGLYDLLLKPAEALIAPGERLVVLPDGPLDTLPFAALMRKETHKGKKDTASYLVEWKPIHTVVSGTVYAEIKKSRGEKDWTVQMEAFGDPEYVAAAKKNAGMLKNAGAREVVTRGWNLEPLPFTRVEVESLASLEPQPNLKYLGLEATEERAKSAGKNVRYLHFAVHGLLDERFPLNSALALTIPEKPAEGQDNGLLQAWEVFEQVRINADLVTLSACDTALGKEMGGEGLVGLTRAFHYAGAHSVLASLWSVSDKSTVELMKRFYGYLKDGKSKDEALRAAQVDMIHAKGEGGLSSAFAHPFHWAAFQLSGDWK